MNALDAGVGVWYTILAPGDPGAPKAATREHRRNERLEH